MNRSAISWRVSWLFWVGFGLCVVASLYSVGLRYRVESRNKATAIALEAQTIADTAGDQGVPFGEALKQLSDVGMGMMVLNEETLRDRELREEVKIAVDNTGGTSVTSSDSSLWLDLGIVGQSNTATFSQTIEQVRGFSSGFRPLFVESATKAGIPVIGRYASRSKLDSENLAARLKRDKERGFYGYLPLGERVLGFRSEMRTVSDLLMETGMVYLSPEFAKIAGEEAMTRLSYENTVRLHAIQAAEADRLSKDAFEERFSKAFAERNMRVLLVRPIEPSASKPLATLVESVKSLREAIEREGAVLGVPRPFDPPGVPSLIRYLIAAGVACALAGIVLSSVTNSFWRGLLMLFSAMVVAFPAKYVALIAALIFPIAAIIFLLQWRPKNGLLAALTLFAVCLGGSLCIPGLLNDVRYYVRADVFPAVKLAHFAPILVIALLMFGSVISFKEIWRKPLTVGGLIMGLGVLGVLGFMAIRTGNDGPGGVSGVELAFRSMLESVLITRPRTKEFLFGYPALVIGLQLFVLRSSDLRIRLMAASLISLGAIGLTSSINTMCHLHTPIQVGLTRIFIGAAFGFLIGYVMWNLVRPSVNRLQERAV